MRLPPIFVRLRVANGATTEIAPANANPLPGKSINADFQIRYVEDEPRRNEPVPQNGEPLVETTPGKEDDASSNAEAQKNWWAEAIAKNMDIADGYTKVAVLLIKWADHLDELRTADEVYLGEAHRDRID